MEGRHHRSPSTRKRRSEVRSGSSRLLHQVGRVKSSGANHYSQNHAMPMKVSNHKIRYPPCLLHRQWEIVRLPTFPRMVHKAEDLEILLVPWTPSDKWFGGGHKQDYLFDN